MWVSIRCHLATQIELLAAAVVAQDVWRAHDVVGVGRSGALLRLLRRLRLDQVRVVAVHTLLLVAEWFEKGSGSIRLAYRLCSGAELNRRRPDSAAVLLGKRRVQGRKHALCTRR